MLQIKSTDINKILYLHIIIINLNTRTYQTKIINIIIILNSNNLNIYHKNEK